MQFKSTQQRDLHEKLIHRDLFEQAAERMIDVILNKSNPIDLIRKVVYINEKAHSYNDISKMDKNSEDYMKIRGTLMRFVKDWISQRPQHTVEDFFRIATFSITGDK